MAHLLSKSRYIKGLQCKKRLYLDKYQRDLKDPLTPEQEMRFAIGGEVGELAKDVFPGGVDMTPEHFWDWSPSIQLTRDAIDKGVDIIYEAAFEVGDIMAAIDILVKIEGKWYGYEVKSSTKISPTYIKDAALQFYVISQSGIQLEDLFIMHVNTNYVRKGAIDLNELFKSESVLSEIKPLQADIASEITDQLAVFELNSPPDVEIGPHCNEPYACDFIGTCWKDIPSPSIFDISGLQSDVKWELYQEGKVTFGDIEGDDRLSENQKLQVHAVNHNHTIVEQDEIDGFLGDIEYPVYHLDFETTAFPIPPWDGVQVYRQIPFQYSIHIQDEICGNPKHKEYLASDYSKDPRLEFAERLIEDCGIEGTILVYNISFERSIVWQLIKLFPQHREPLVAIIDRMQDLMVPFKNKWYYLPEMNGSYSIKNVLPALVPDMDYSELEIGNGGMASNTYAQLVQGVFDGDKNNVRNHLLAYCKLDTYAMVKLLNNLYQV